jgi:hypothetical protein
MSCFRQRNGWQTQVLSFLASPREPTPSKSYKSCAMTVQLGYPLKNRKPKLLLYVLRSSSNWRH